MSDIREGDSMLAYNDVVGIVTQIKLDTISRKQYHIHWANSQVSWVDYNTAVNMRERYVKYQSR